MREGIQESFAKHREDRRLIEAGYRYFRGDCVVGRSYRLDAMILCGRDDRAAA